MNNHRPRFLLCAPASNTGKTLITCGILMAYKLRGLKLTSFKCGPDYIDPMFHARVIGTKSRNLDSFFTGEMTTKYLFAKASKDSDLSVIEGVMGYYDGLGGVSSTASTYDVAKITNTPAVLIVNARGASLSIVALIKGFLTYKNDSHIKGVILNQISPMIYERLKEVIEKELSVKVFGYVPKMDDLNLKSRHLGLVMPGEINELKEKLSEFASVLEKTLDLDGMLAMAEGAEDFQNEELVKPSYQTLSDKVSIAYASDEAFCFTYEDNLDLLRDMGAVMIPFSPVHDNKIPENARGIILSGGYPEIYGKELSRNTDMLASIREAYNHKMPMIAECGGFLYLHEYLQGQDLVDYPMAGICKKRAYKTDKLGRFGYITLTCDKDSMLLNKGQSIKGHEFHYWESEDPGEDLEAKKPVGNRQWKCGMVNSWSYMGFPHLFLYSNPKAAYGFMKKCEEWSW